MIRSLTALALLAATAAPAFAGDDVRTVEIRYDARDLAHPERVRELEARIADAAEDVCEFADRYRFDTRRAERRCEERAVNEALAELRARTGQPAVQPAARDVSAR